MSALRRSKSAARVTPRRFRQARRPLTLNEITRVSPAAVAAASVGIGVGEAARRAAARAAAAAIGLAVLGY